MDQEVACFNEFVDRTQKVSSTTQKQADGMNDQDNDSKAPDEPDRDEKSKHPTIEAFISLLRKSPEEAPLEDARDIFDISQEIKLLREVKDIRDELNILRNLFGQQKRVVESYYQLARPEKDLANFLDGIQSHIDVVEVMDEDAKRPYKSVRKLPFFESRIFS